MEDFGGAERPRRGRAATTRPESRADSGGCRGAGKAPRGGLERGAAPSPPEAKGCPEGRSPFGRRRPGVQGAVEAPLAVGDKKYQIMDVEVRFDRRRRKNEHW